MSLSNISIKTLNMFDKAILEHKKKVIEDIYNTYLQQEDHKYSLEDINKELLKHSPPPKRKIIKRQRKILDCCNARVWDSKGKIYNRCKFNKLNNSDYCGIHKNKQNYGNI
jgi:hypothetical protein